MWRRPEVISGMFGEVTFRLRTLPLKRPLIRQIQQDSDCCRVPTGSDLSRNLRQLPDERSQKHPIVSSTVIQTVPKHSMTASASLDIVRDILGDDFDVWVHDDCWRRDTGLRQGGHQPEPAVPDELVKHLSNISTGSQAKFETLNDGRILCLLSVPGSYRPTVAVRVLPAHSADVLQIAERGMHTALSGCRKYQSMQRRLYESESQLTAFSNRISRGNSELSWLHELATHSELNETQNDSIHVARRILPDMRKIMSARAVVFVSEPCGLSVDGIPLNAWQTGDMKVPGRICLELIRRYGASALTKTAVINYPEPRHRLESFPGVLSAIVRSVSRHGIQSGWLLAVNRDLSQITHDIRPEYSSGVIDHMCEFGEFESSLVNAAANALATHARNSSLLEEKQSLISGAIRSLVNAIDAKDHYTCGHSDRVAAYARQIASTMQMDDEFCEQIYMTGLLHDVGKIGVPDEVLQKPGRLTEAEFDKIKQHPLIGHQILQHLSGFTDVLPGVLHHHESVDGSGYPYGLQGEEIPLDARILAVADAYDAMTSDRPYRDGMPSEKAEAIIAEGAGRQWDQNCVAAFQSCIDGIRLIAHDSHRTRVRRPGIAGNQKRPWK